MAVVMTPKAATRSMAGTLTATKNKSADGVVDAALDDAQFLKNMHITPELNQTPEIRNAGLAAVEAEKAGGIVDSVDQATMMGWNAQMALPVAAGVGGWLAKKGDAWGPVFGAVPKGLSHVFSAPQKMLKLEAQDVAFHRGSSRLFGDAKKHVNAANRFHSEAAHDLAKAQEALKGDSFAGLRETLANASRGFSDIHAEKPLGLTSDQAAKWEAKGNLFSTEKAQALRPGAIRDSFDAGVANLTGSASGAARTAVAEQTLTAQELNALKKARKHMENFAANAAKMQEHAGNAEPVLAQARITARQEIEKKGRFIKTAQGKLQAAGDKAEQMVSGSRPLRALRENRVNSFTNSAKGHAARAEKIQAEALKRLDTSIAALGDNPKFAELKGMLQNTREQYGKLPTVKEREGLERIAANISKSEEAIAKAIKNIKKRGLDGAETSALEGAEKSFGGHFLESVTGAVSNLKKYGSLNGPEARALGKAEKSFSGRFFGLGGAVKKLTSAHGALEAQGAAEANAAFLNDLGESAGKLPKSLLKTSGTHLLDHGLYYGSQGVTALRTLQVTGTGFGAFKELSGDVEGKKISTASAALQLMHLAPVDEAVKEARAQFWKSVGPRVLGNVAGMAAFKKVMERGASGKTQMLGMAIQMGAAGAGEMIGSRNQLLDAYHQVAKARKMGSVDKGAYLGLIVHAHKANNINLEDKRLVSVAEQYAQENSTAANVLKEIASGAFAKRLAAAEVPAPALAEAEQQKLREEIKAEAPKLTVANAEMAHLEGRADKANAALIAEQPVVGNFSAKVAGNRSARTLPAPAVSHVEAVKNSNEQSPVGAAL